MVMKRLREMRKRNLVLLAVAVTMMFGLVFGYFAGIIAVQNKMDLPFIPSDAKCGIQMSAVNITPKVEQYLTANFLSAYGLEAKVTSTTQNGSIVVLGVNIFNNGTKVSTGEVYATPDGEMILLGTLYNMSVSVPQLDTTETQAETQQQTQESQKSEKPTVSLYVMSFCPYGQQAENAMWPVLDLMKDQFDFELHYVVYPTDYYKGQEATYCMNNTYCAMHGVAEMNENMRQMCVKESYNSSVWLNYVKGINSQCSAQTVETCWEGVAQSVGVDAAAVKSCFGSSATSFAAAEQALNDQYEVGGSPALFINGVEYSGSGGRSAEAYKTAICNAFNTAPAECNQTLSSGTTAASGSCG